MLCCIVNAIQQLYTFIFDKTYSWEFDFSKRECYTTIIHLHFCRDLWFEFDFSKCECYTTIIHLHFLYIHIYELYNNFIFMCYTTYLCAIQQLHTFIFAETYSWNLTFQNTAQSWETCYNLTRVTFIYNKTFNC